MTYLSLAKQYILLFFPNTLARSLVWELKCKLLVLQQYPQKFFIFCISSPSFHLCYFRTMKSELIVFIKRHVRTALRQQSGKWVSLNTTNINPSSPLPYRSQYLWTVNLLCSPRPLFLSSPKVTAFLAWPHVRSWPIWFCVTNKFDHGWNCIKGTPNKEDVKQLQIRQKGNSLQFPSWKEFL